MPNKLTYIISNINKSLSFELVAANLDRNKFYISFILLNPGDSELERYLKHIGIPVKRIKYSGKKDIPRTIFQVFVYLIKEKPKIVHAHLFDASIVGLVAARMSRIKKRIYTRHHNTFHHVYHPSAVKWDILCNRLASDIVSVSQTVTETLVNLENVNIQKIHKIWHGFDLKSLSSAPAGIVNTLRERYNPANKYPVVGVISRFTEWKGVQYIIPAFKEFLKDEPDALLLLFNAHGDYELEINQLLNELPSSSFKKVRFENEISALYHTFTVFIHTPVDHHSEAFGQTYIECMACSVPLIATRSGIGNEILEDGINSIVVPYKDSSAILNALLKLGKIPGLKEKLTHNAWISVKDKFGLEVMIEKLETLYLQ